MMNSCHSCHRFLNSGFIHTIYLSFKHIYDLITLFYRMLHHTFSVRTALLGAGVCTPPTHDKNDKNDKNYKKTLHRGKTPRSLNCQHRTRIPTADSMSVPSRKGDST
jgi:hypothetical protein